MALDFPALMDAISKVSRPAETNYLRRTLGWSTNEFIDAVGTASVGVWGQEAYGGRYLFTKGTGASALLSLGFLLVHVKSKWGGSLETYLRKVKGEWPLSQWRSGSGILSRHRGGGAGGRIVDDLLKKTIPGFEVGTLPEPRSVARLGELEPILLDRLVPLFQPSKWRPLTPEFVRSESGAGVYAIVGLNRALTRAKIRIGKAENLAERLTTHSRTLDARLPEGVAALFYDTVRIPRNALEHAEAMTQHLVTDELLIVDARHPAANCVLC